MRIALRHRLAPIGNSRARLPLRAAVLLPVLLILLPLRPAHADGAAIFADFTKCDGLMGETFPAVLRALGPPSETNAPYVLQSYMTTNMVCWQYYAVSDTPFLELLFSNKVLVVARLRLTGAGRSVAANAAAEDAAVLTAYKNCTPSSLKMVYTKAAADSISDPGSGSPQFCYYADGITQKGNTLHSYCAGGDTRPMISHRVLNAATGLYQDVRGPNPDFSFKTTPVGLNLTLFRGHGEPYERYQWTPAQFNFYHTHDHYNDQTYKLGRLFDEIIGIVDINMSPVVSIPMTPKNSPWLFRP